LEILWNIVNRASMSLARFRDEVIAAAVAFGLATRRQQVRARLPAEIDLAISGCSSERRHDEPQPQAYTKEIR
jgi:hypothetical protein